MVAVIVGRKTSDGTCRLVTMSENADEPHLVTFPIPTASSPLTPGKPNWANYFKGVMAHIRNAGRLQSMVIGCICEISVGLKARPT